MALFRLVLLPSIDTPRAQMAASYRRLPIHDKMGHEVVSQAQWKTRWWPGRPRGPPRAVIMASPRRSSPKKAVRVKGWRGGTATLASWWSPLKRDHHHDAWVTGERDGARRNRD